MHYIVNKVYKMIIVFNQTILKYKNDSGIFFKPKQ